MSLLKPVVDEHGILRVGRRISHVSIAEEQRHPILLRAEHHVTKKIIHYEHITLKHAGTQAFTPWIQCFRSKLYLAAHHMGILPV